MSFVPAILSDLVPPMPSSPSSGSAVMPPAPTAHGSQFTPASVLLIEDNLADVRLTVELLREAKLANRLKVIGDGLQALAHMNDTGPDAAPLPDLVLLDLDLPGANGRTVLAQMRAQPRLAQIPVFMLTASATHREMVREEGLDADGYLEKPIDLAAFVYLVTHHDRFWLKLVCASRSPQ